MAYYIAPGSEKNIRLSIETPINRYINEQYQTEFSSIEQYMKDSYGEIYAWAITNNNKCKKYGREIKSGDRILIYETKGSEDSLYIVNVIDKICGDLLPKVIWGDNEKDYYWTILLDNKTVVKISKNNLLNGLGYERLCGIQRISEQREELLERLLKSILNEAVIEDKTIEKDLIDKYWNGKTFGNVTVSYSHKANSRKNNVKLKKSKRMYDSRSNVPKKIIGITGEKIFKEQLDLLGSKENLWLASKLKIETIGSFCIEWFNEKIDFRDKNFNDLSVGKGYDIKMTIDNCIYKFEVKSSYNAMNVFSLTRNELVEMKMTTDRYYIILVEKLSSQPEISVISNLDDLFNVECIESTKEHSIYLSKLDNRFFV